jgi:hypothetical protein
MANSKHVNNIKEAIGLYNQINRLKGEDKLTQKKLALLVFDDLDISEDAKAQLLGWCIAEERKMSFHHLRNLATVLKCDLYFLLGLK